MAVIIIAAVAKNGVIGKNNKLPWDIPEELQHFRSITAGSTVLMGRKTFESVGRPLPNRKNIIITRSALSIPGVTVCASVEEGLEKAKAYNKDVFIIGGANIYEQTIPLADKLYISHIKKEYEGDTYFPEFDRAEWEVEKKKEYSEFTFVVYGRKVREGGGGGMKTEEEKTT